LLKVYNALAVPSTDWIHKHDQPVSSVFD